jgi:hypothetical protein
MVNLTYYQNFISYLKENGITWESHDKFMSFKTAPELEEEAKKILPPIICTMLFNQHNIKQKLALYINSDSIWLRLTSLYCLKNPI